MMAMVGLVAGVLLIAGAGSLILTHQAARRQAIQELITEAQSLANGKGGASKSLAALRTVRRVLSLEEAGIVRVNVLGNIVTALPQGITVADLDPKQLLDGDTVSGFDGNLVYAAVPVPLSIIEPAHPNFRGQIAVVLTRQVGDPGPSWGYFLVAGGVALAVAALVAAQMSRRMARPLIETMEVTGRIAAGDLESRVPLRDADYSEFASLARSVNGMAQSLQDSRVRERHLLLSVSHDLRTPLTSIRGFAEAIMDGAIEDSHRAAEVIIAESRRLERLVGDLLDLTKLEGKQLSIHIRPTDAAEVVSTTAEGFRPMAERNSVALVVDAAALGDVRVVADPDRLAQLLANLLENAFTFARTRVRVGVEPGGVVDGAHFHLITVEDDGPGISSGDLPRVFERFYQADRGPTRKVGSGLGLAIVAELAAAMGATIRAESPITPDGGSRFVLSLWQD
jgi:two-component system sensor histidine kinase BaeS